MREDPRLYEIAKRITLQAGYPWTDPRTGETFHPGTTKKPKNRKHEKSSKTR
jgi:hypothetical protein